MPQDDDLKLAIDALTKKSITHRKMWDYYDGTHPLVFSSEKLREVFKREVPFVENWCEVIVNAALDRIRIAGWEVKTNKELSGRINELCEETKLTRSFKDVHKAAGVTGESFVICGLDEDNRPEAYYNDPKNVIVIYDSANPRKKLFAAKWWTDERAKKRFLNMYYPDRIEHYVCASLEGDTFTALPGEDGEQPNPWAEIPVFHFRRDLRITCGDLTKSILSIQNSINKLFSDMMVASDFTAYVQRWVIGGGEQEGKPALSSGGLIQFNPAAEGEQPTQTGTWPASDMKNFLEPMDKLCNAAAIISRTPKHYFFGEGANLSGEALQIMEAPLVQKVMDAEEFYGDVWAEVASFLLKLDGKNVPAVDISVTWDDPRTKSATAEANVRVQNKAAGIPLSTTLRWEGRTPDEIEQVQKEISLESNLATVPPIKALPKNLPEDIGGALATKAKQSLSKNMQPDISAVLDSVGPDVVERIVADGSLARFMQKWGGKIDKVRSRG